MYTLAEEQLFEDLYMCGVEPYEIEDPELSGKFGNWLKKTGKKIKSKGKQFKNWIKEKPARSLIFAPFAPVTATTAASAALATAATAVPIVAATRGIKKIKARKEARAKAEEAKKRADQQYELQKLALQKQNQPQVVQEESAFKKYLPYIAAGGGTLLALALG